MSRPTPDAAMAHFHTLTAAGWSLRAIAAHAGVPATDLSRFVRHGADLPHVVHRIMRVDPATIPQRTTPAKAGVQAEPFVPRIGTVRRVQALLYMGWTHADLQGRSGLRTACLLSQQGRWVTRSTHDRTAELYRALSHIPGPSDATRARARKRGYAGPADWEDIDLDEAPAKPSELCQADGCLNLARGTTDPRNVGPTGAYCTHPDHRDLALSGAA